MLKRCTVGNIVRVGIDVIRNINLCCDVSKILNGQSHTCPTFANFRRNFHFEFSSTPSKLQPTTPHSHSMCAQIE